MVMLRPATVNSLRCDVVDLGETSSLILASWELLSLIEGQGLLGSRLDIIFGEVVRWEPISGASDSG